MYDLVIEDATVVSGQGRVVADIGIRKGRIAFIGARAPGRAKVRISAIGKFIMPGIVDMAVRLGAPGLAAAESWETETRAAVSSGVTTLIELPDSIPLSRSAKSISTKRKLARPRRPTWALPVAILATRTVPPRLSLAAVNSPSVSPPTDS